MTFPLPGLVLLSIIGDLIIFYYCDELDLYGERDEEAVEMTQADATTQREAQPMNSDHRPQEGGT